MRIFSAVGAAVCALLALAALISLLGLLISGGAASFASLLGRAADILMLAALAAVLGHRALRSGSPRRIK